MRRIDFITTRKQTWYALDDAITHFNSFKHNDLTDEPAIIRLMKNYRKTVADLSLARTLFAGDQLVTELNNLVLRALMIISVKQRGDLQRIGRFFTSHLPRLVLRLKTMFFVSSALFLVSCLAGYGLTLLEPYAANAIVGDQYLSMTLDNINKGTPFAVYQSSFAFGMSSFIMANNIKVAFAAFAFGIFYGLGTGMVLIMNGLMLGSICAFFGSHGLLADFVTTVLIHGTLELFAIMVAGAAGLRLGQSLFKPGTISRKHAVYLFGVEAFHLTAVMIPVFIIAGFLEGFITPQSIDMSLRIVIIGASALFLFLYLILPAILFTQRQKKQQNTYSPSTVMQY